MKEKASILEVNIDRVNMEQSIQRVMNFLEDKNNQVVFTPNSEIIMMTEQNPSYKKVINAADLLVPDGIGVILASKIIGKPLEERVAGFDLLTHVLHKLEKKTRIYLLGGKPGVAQKAGEKMMQMNKNILICGCRDGYDQMEEEEEKILEEIQQSGAECLLVALGAPRQEEWIDRHKSKLNTHLCMGVGGSLDIFAGASKRAPDIFIRFGLEWFYRLLRQPWRFIRMLSLPKFIMVVMVRKYKPKKR
jgi:N-acetylglucosaminyldiphosphoundecaprenol N-acetyl-beta-D-mannosaminyltransferase